MGFSPIIYRDKGLRSDGSFIHWYTFSKQRHTRQNPNLNYCLRLTVLVIEIPNFGLEIWDSKFETWNSGLPNLGLFPLKKAGLNLGVHISSPKDLYCKLCLWSIFGPCLCTKSCKTTFYAHLSRIWKLARFTRFIRKVFATKILLSGKFSLFVTLQICKGTLPIKKYKWRSGNLH